MNRGKKHYGRGRFENLHESGHKRLPKVGKITGAPVFQAQWGDQPEGFQRGFLKCSGESY